MPVNTVKGTQKTKAAETKTTVRKNEKVNIKFTSNPSAAKNEKKTQILSDTTKGIIDSITKTLGLKFYSKEIVQNPKEMIVKSQNHLLGLIKYYEGDAENNYEAKLETYKDKYNKKTKGFGCTKKLVNIKTQEQAYSQLEKDLTESNTCTKNKINNRLGKGVYEKLPLSLKEALIDLSFNKGPDKVTKPELIEAIKNKDYSTVIRHLAYVHSGEKKNGTEEDPGLYRRSLSRMILATRDLTGKEKAEANIEIENIYKKAKTCFIKNNISTSTLDDIYTYYKTGKFTDTNTETVKTEKPGKTEELTSGSYKFTVDSSFKGKGAFAIARANYEAQDTDKMSFTDFYALFNKLNSKDTLENIKVGDTVIVPQIKGGKSVIQNKQEEQNDSVNVNQNQSMQNNKPGIIRRIYNKIKPYVKSIWEKCRNFFRKDSAKEEFADGFDEDPNATPFKNILRNRNKKIVEESHTIKTSDGKSIEYTIQTISVVHEVKPKETIWGISHKYGIGRKELCEYNEIENENKINIGQKININRLGYKIKKGDTLYGISKKFGLTPEVLMQLNGIEEGEVTDLKEGTIIELPGFIYRVIKGEKDGLGESFEEIANKVGVDKKILMNINNRSKDLIVNGDEIKIIYNNPDYDKIPSAVTSQMVNGKTIEKIDMSSSDKILKNPKYKYLRYKTKVNGLVVANRAEFAPKGKGPLSGHTIILNAGHGYGQALRDPGAVVEKDGLNPEWILNYDNVLRLIPKLQAQGARVIYLQGHRNLIQKALKQPENKGDLFISLHCNIGKGDDTTKDRTQFYYRDNVQKGNAKNESIEFAKFAEQMFDKKYKTDSYAETRTNDDRTGLLKTPVNIQQIPGIIWEVAFMDSRKGRQRLKSNTAMNDYMNTMTNTIVEFIKAKDKKKKNPKLIRKID